MREFCMRPRYFIISGVWCIRAHPWPLTPFPGPMAAMRRAGLVSSRSSRPTVGKWLLIIVSMQGLHYHPPHRPLTILAVARRASSAQCEEPEVPA